MTVEAFATERAPEWERLRELTAHARGRPERLGVDGVLELGTRYRAAAADLAEARRRYPHDAVVPFLEELVVQARHLVYDAPRRREDSLGRFVLTTYWQRVAARPWLLALSAVLLFGTGMIGLAWAGADPDAAVRFLPEEMRSVTEPAGGTDLRLDTDEQAAFASAIFTNNIRVTFAAFAGGVLLGLGTAASLAFNGVLLGVVAGLSVDAGNGARLVELVAPHGFLELSCIVVAGAAGFRLADGIARPGRRSRREAVVQEGSEAVLVVIGTAPWLVLAGLVEGFVTPRGIGVPAAVALGLALAVVFWALVLWRGTRRPTNPSVRVLRPWPGT